MSVFTLMIVFALIATIVTLAWGIGSMAVGGNYDEKHSEQLMFARIALQTLAFVLLLVAVFFSLA